MVRFLFAALPLAFAVLATTPVMAQDTEGLAYEVRLSGVEGDLRTRIEESASLYRLADKPPPSIPALRARLDADLERVAAILKSEGYYGYTLEHRIHGRERPVPVEIEVNTGEPYRLRSYEIRYTDEVAPDAPARPVDPATLRIPLDRPARASGIVDTETRLLRRLGREGYPFARRQERRVVVDHDTRGVRVELALRSGPFARFGPVAVDGAEDVEDDYVRRVADIPEGTPFSADRVDEGRRRLFGTRLFETAAVQWDEDDIRPDGTLPITVTVIEREQRSIGAGVNYSTTDGPGVETSWTHRNLLGRNERLQLGLSIAETEQLAFADLLKPHVGRLDQNLKARLEARQAFTDAYDQLSFGGTLSVERPLWPNWTGSLGVSTELTQIEESGRPEEQFVILGLPGELRYDGTDDLFDPSRGARLTFHAEPVALTGDRTASFLYGSVAGSTYYQLVDDKRVILAGRARFASLAGASRASVPASRRLYAGGGGSIRGYQFQKVGPLDARNEPDGGLALFETSVEARIRVWGDFGVVPFLDGGTAFEEPWPDGGTIRWAAGLGLRYYTPIGPVRFDIALPLNKREDVDSDYEFYISLGQAF